MFFEWRDNNLWADIFWDDLSTEAKEELLIIIGDNANFDIFPIATINISPNITT